MIILRQSTARTILVGPILDASGVAKTDDVVGSIKITKNGTVGAANGSATLTHDHAGKYLLALTASDTDTLGIMQVSLNSGTNDMQVRDCMVLTATAYDTLVTNGTLASTTSGRTIVVDASGIVTDTSGITTILSRLTSTRAGNLDLLDVAISTLQSQITALNNLSAKANWFGSALLEVPDSGTRAYVYELVIKDDEDKLVNLDSLPTITLTNSAGTDRSSLITTGIANAATGRYTLTITVGTSTTNEALVLRAAGTISAEARYAVLALQVVDYDSATLINSIYTRIGAPAGASIAADIAGVKTVADTVAADTTTLKSRITANLFSGITYMKNWLAVLMGKTADTTTRAEVNATTAGAGYNETTDSLEAIRDRGDAAWVTGSGGGGSGDATAANQTTIINHLTDIKGAGWSSTTDTLEKIRDAITAALDSVIASVGVTPGALTGWPETMSIGDSYTDDCSRSIHLLVRDSGDTPITSIGSHAFTDADFTATVVLSQGAQRGRVIGTATWEVGPEGYLNVQIPSKESRRAAEGTATVQVLLRWTDSGDQYTLPSTTTRWIAQL